MSGVSFVFLLPPPQRFLCYDSLPFGGKSALFKLRRWIAAIWKGATPEARGSLEDPGIENEASKWTVVDDAKQADFLRQASYMPSTRTKLLCATARDTYSRYRLRTLNSVILPKARSGTRLALAATISLAHAPSPAF